MSLGLLNGKSKWHGALTYWCLRNSTYGSTKRKSTSESILWVVSSDWHLNTPELLFWFWLGVIRWTYEPRERHTRLVVRAAYTLALAHGLIFLCKETWIPLQDQIEVLVNYLPLFLSFFLSVFSLMFLQVIRPERRGKGKCYLVHQMSDPRDAWRLLYYFTDRRTDRRTDG